jgi:threonylcarbamoyladenosine tRNA methylthiotransferase MtaB
MNFYIKTLGCKVNQAESDDVTKLLTEYGHLYTKSPTQADIIIINTCTVTHIADRKSRQMIRKLQNENSLADIIITGCSVENKSSNLPEVGTLVKKTDLLKYISRFSAPCNNRITTEISKTKKNILVQNGCNYFCSYCIIPFVRNTLTSYPVEQILTEAQQSIEQGIKEIVLTGINLGLYNHNGVTLSMLIGRLLQLKGDFRIRLGSIEPNLVTDELLSLIETEAKLCPHLHIPLQGTTENLLKLMQRKYTLSFYLSLITKINNLQRKTTITSDIIIGHPGETKEDFSALLSLLKQNIFLNVHLFAYSARQGTQASQQPNQVPEPIKNERVKFAQEALAISRKTYLLQMIGITGAILIEKQLSGHSEGHTEHYVLCQTKEPLPTNNFYTGKYQKVLTSNNTTTVYFS